MRALLTVEIAVHRIAVFAEMAWFERRPELGLLCRAAREQSNRLSPAIVQSVLPGISDAGARNILSWCRTLGLVDAGNALSALGQEVADRDEAPLPEQGVYDLWLVDHPLLGPRILAAERLSTRQDPGFDAIQALPIVPDLGTPFRSVSRSKERFLLRSLPSNHGEPGCMIGETRGRCTVRWNIDFTVPSDHWRLEGSLEVPSGNGKYAQRPFEHEPETTGLDGWKLAAIWADGPLRSAGTWDSAARRLAVPFTGRSDPEIDTCRASLVFSQVEVPARGTFDKVVLDDVPIGPATPADAQAWAMARLDRWLAARTSYVSRADVRARFVELVDGSPLERFQPVLPSHDELVARPAAKEPAAYWALAAPVDLAPYTVAESDLAPLHIGVASAASATDDTRVVRIPYRGAWSMLRLAERLLAGTTPVRVLLVDRYVRGTENLASLRLLADSIRSLGLRDGLEVWTEEQDADLAQIRSITGVAPRRYRDVFGSTRLHDRYLLILGAGSPGFGWHMSNSPLHARSDLPDARPETPLRWADLMAHRVAADALEPAMRRWLAGGTP